ncbi:MAG: 2'-deoxycytidine 5'-triphosphate deaminase [Actinomycetota bacterium]|nr:2'-deoxycytidine 5'-triphosphate deaminase [Actinomycetota bacterium]
MLTLPSGEGVLPNQCLSEAIAEGWIDAAGFTIPTENVQPASLDLRLGETAYRIRCSFLPTSQSVERKVKDLVIDELNLHGEGVVLETNRPYLIPLKEQLALPPGVRGKANPKSSTGRADVFTRVITDRGYRFDEIRDGYHGKLYLEVVPLSFPVRVREDLSLNQLRLSVGRAELTDDEVRTAHERAPLLFLDGQPLRTDQLELADGLFLGLNLRGDDEGRVGYKARDNAPLLDMTKVGSADPESYWETVRREYGDRIVLTPKNFYLLMSHEAVTIPPSLAAEMTAYDPTSGELRTHYAGFFDPGFGYAGGGERFHGSTAALEVRAHDVPFMIEHGQRVCKLTFERMLAEPTQLYGQKIGSNYQRQTDTRGKHFRLPNPVAKPAQVREVSGRAADDDGQLELPT